MGSLAGCIKKAGKALDRNDVKAIRQIHDDLVAAGDPKPAENAVAEYMNVLSTERRVLETTIRDQGGQIPSDLQYAKNTLKEVARKISLIGILDGDEQLDIPGAKVTRAGKLKATAKQLAEALIKRQRAANRGRRLDSRTERTKEIVSNALVMEVEAAIERSDNAADWYTNTLRRAVNVAAEIHPELKTDANAKTMFMLGLAITSNGQEVYENSRTAEEVYAHFKKTGKFPIVAYGNQGNAMAEGFQVANDLIEKWGLDMFAQFLMTEFTVGELNQLGFQVSGENVDFKTHGSVIFGPKVGGGFFQNLMGNYSPITMDRWFMRTWGRLTGTLLPDQDVMPEAATARFVEEITANPDMVRDLGWTVDEALESNESLLMFAKVVHRAYARSSSKWSKTYGDKSDFNKAGKNLDVAMNSPVIAPTNGNQRDWIREVSAAAIEKLRQRGVPVNGASMQALIWYPEKDLYLKYGVGNAKSAPTDYEKEFARIARDKGIDQRRIDAARIGDTDERSATDARDERRSPRKSAVEEAAPETLTKSGRTRLLHFEATRRIREQLPRAYRGTVPKGPQRSVNGVRVVSVHKPQIKTRNAYKKVGLATPEILELEASEDSAQLFHSKISAAANANKAGAAVYVYPQDEYESMRLFMTQDGMAGFALNGNDIVSVFKHPDAGMPGVAQSLIAAATSEGGSRLDAFDTVLPTIYSLQGFRVVARIPWDDSQAPANWDKKTFKAFNDGEPDVVFMVYDRNHPHAYTGRNEGQLVDDYDRAVQIQAEAVEALHERNKPSRDSILYSLPNDVEENINSRPASPLARLHKLGATMEDQAMGGKLTLTKRRIQDLVDFLSDRGGIKVLLAMLPRRYLGDFLPKSRAPSLHRYLRQANRMSGRRNELMMKREETARKWAQWSNKNKEASGRLSELMHAATLAGVDPSIPYKPLKKPENMSDADKEVDALRREQYEILSDFWERLDSTAHEIYVEVRDSYLDMRRGVEEGLKVRIEESEADGKTKAALMDKLREQFEAGRVAGPYFPLMRYGDIWAAAKDQETGEIVSFSRFENRKEQKEWIGEFRKAGYSVETGRHSEQQTGEMLERIDPQFATRVAELVRQTGDETLVDEIWQMYLRSLPEMSVRKHFMHRKGRLGFAADGLRAFATVAFRSAHQQAKLEYMHRMERTLKELYSEVRAIENDPEADADFNWAMPVHDEMVRRHRAAQNPDAAPWAVRTTGAGFLWYLGFTPAAALVNLSQTAIVGFPVLSAEFNVVGAGSELLRASKLWAGAKGSIENRLRGDERRAFEEARRIGLFEKTQAHDLAGVTEKGAAGQYGGLEHQAMEIGSFLFHHAERMNREVTFLAAYRLGRRRGDAHADAVLKAEDLVWDSHFDYNNDNRPVWMQNNVGRVVTLFKQYSLNMTYRIFRDFRDGFFKNRNLTKAETLAAKKRFAGIMGVTFLLAGYAGMPTAFTAIPHILGEIFFEDEDEPFDFEDAMRTTLTEWMGPKAAHFIMDGVVDAGLGATLSDRVSLGNLWWRDPGVNDEGRDYMMSVFMDLLGPVPTTAFDILEQSGKLVTGDQIHPERGIERMIPKALRDLIRAYRYSTEGALTQHTPPDTLVAAEDFSPLDIFWQAIGFSPSEVTLQYEQNTALRRAEKHIRDRRSILLTAYANAIFNDDKKEAEAVMEKIVTFNGKNPSIYIDGGSLRSTLRSRMNRNLMSRGGVTLDKRLMHLYDEYNFTGSSRPKTSDGREEE